MRPGERFGLILEAVTLDQQLPVAGAPLALTLAAGGLWDVGGIPVLKCQFVPRRFSNIYRCCLNSLLSGFADSSM